MPSAPSPLFHPFQAARPARCRRQVAIENELMHRHAEEDMRADPRVQAYRQRQAGLLHRHTDNEQRDLRAGKEHSKRRDWVDRFSPMTHRVRIFRHPGRAGIH